MTERRPNRCTPPPAELAASQGGLASYPPVERWDDWVEYDPVGLAAEGRAPLRADPDHLLQLRGGLRAARLRRQARRSRSRSSRATPRIPGSRGRNCAKGPATLNQVNDPERIRYPLRRVGPRGGGQWERVTWDEALDDIAGRIRKALVEGRQTEVMYHLGRPGHELVYLQRVFHAWGIDGHNSHTNVCSAERARGLRLLARHGPPVARSRQRALHPAALLAPRDRPLLQPARPADHRGQDARRQDRACSTRGSPTPRRWPTGGSRRGPGREAAVLLAMAPHPRAREALRPRLRAPLGELGRVPARGAPRSAASTFEAFERALDELYAPLHARSSPRRRAGSPAASIVEIAREHRPRRLGAGDPHLAQHRRRQPRRLAGGARARAASSCSRARSAPPGGTAPSAWNKAVPAPPMMPPPGKIWSELLMPREYPLAFFEMSFLLPHFLREGRGKLAMYFTRVYNPVWTNPDGIVVDRDADRRDQGRAPRVPHPDLERDGVVRRLRAADGARLRAPRPHVAGDPRRALDRLPPAGAARGPGSARASASTARGRPTRRRASGRSGRRTSSGSSCPGGSIPTARSASGSTSSRRTGRARSCASRSSTAGSSRTACPGCRRRPRAKGAHPARVSCASTARS